MRLDPTRSTVRNSSGHLQHFPTERKIKAMKPSRRCMKAPSALLLVISAAFLANIATANELIGFALMPANTFTAGPTSGQFAGPGAGGNAFSCTCTPPSTFYKLLEIERCMAPRTLQVLLVPYLQGAAFLPKRHDLLPGPRAV
jgi:hypothetical protein